MPWYDFKCEDCDFEFEEYMSINDDRSNLKCPKCGGEHVERDFSSISSNTESSKKSSRRCFTGG